MAIMINEFFRIKLRPVILMVLLSCSGCCAPRQQGEESGIRREQPPNLERNSVFEQFKAKIGQRLELTGEPVGSKANYAFKTTAGEFPVSSAWDPKVFNPLKEKNPTIVIEADVVLESGLTIGESARMVQTNLKPGQQLPDRIVLHNIKVLRIKQ
jgi:hypothetical protein